MVDVKRYIQLKQEEEIKFEDVQPDESKTQEEEVKYNLIDD